MRYKKQTSLKSLVGLTYLDACLYQAMKDYYLINGLWHSWALELRGFSWYEA